MLKSITARPAMLSSQVAGFQWDVWLGGYHCVPKTKLDILPAGVDDEPAGTLFLTEQAQGQNALRSYCPMKDYPGLFVTFATAEATPRGMIKFANKYGPLGGPEIYGIPVHCQGKIPPLRVLPIEPVAVWLKEMKLMSSLHELWMAYRTRDNEKIRKYVYFKGSKRTFNFGLFPSPLAAALDRWDEFGLPFYAEEIHAMRSISRGDHLTAALFMLWVELNRKMRSLGLGTTLQWHSSAGHVDLHFEPQDLYTALWFQFAQAVAGGKLFTRCSRRGCDKWFDPDSQKRDKRYCSKACIQKAYRYRKQEAVDLHSSGLEVEQIADHLDVSVDSVKKWVGNI